MPNSFTKTLCPYRGFYLSFQYHWPRSHALDNVWHRFPNWRHRCCQKSLWECHHPSQASFRGLHRSNTNRERYDPGRHPLPISFPFLYGTPPAMAACRRTRATSTPASPEKTSFRRIWPTTSAAPPLQTTSCPTGNLKNHKCKRINSPFTLIGPG